MVLRRCLLLLAVSATAAAPGTSASCLGPSLTVSPGTAKPGDMVTLRGQGWFVGCNDTGQGHREPADSARLTFEQAGRTFELGSAKADKQYRFVKEVRLPDLLLPLEGTFVGRGRNGQARSTLQVSYTR